MQLDQIPKSLCSPLQLLAAVAPSVFSLLYPSFSTAKQLLALSDQHSFWLLCSDRILKPSFKPACAATSSVAVTEPRQQASAQVPFATQDEANPKIQNFSGNSIFAFAVATAVFQATVDLVHAKTLLQSARRKLTNGSLVTAPGATDRRAAIPTPKLMIAATAEAAITTINVNTAADACCHHNSGKGNNCISAINPQQLVCRKLQLYKSDNTRHLTSDDWLSDNQTTFNRAPEKMRFDASFDRLAQSFRLGLLSDLERILTDQPDTSGISPTCSKYVASGQSGVTTAHLSLSSLAKMNQQQQFTAAAVCWCWPIFAVSRHQVAPKSAVYALRMQNSWLPQQKIAVAQNCFLKSSHCFSL